jgi:hypothetical protein
MATPSKRRVYPTNPALFATPPPEPYPGPQVVIDVAAMAPAGPPTSPVPGPVHNAIDRSYGSSDRRELTETDLLAKIQLLEQQPNLQCPNLIVLAALKKQLAEKKSSTPAEMASWITAAHLDLLKARVLAQNYTFGDAVKEQWMTQIDSAQAALQTFAKKHDLTLPEPAKPVSTPVPPKPEFLPYSNITRIAAGIFALLALTFSASLAIHRFLVKKYGS